jgi:hypothetical protein
MSADVKVGRKLEVIKVLKEHQCEHINTFLDINKSFIEDPSYTHLAVVNLTNTHYGYPKSVVAYAYGITWKHAVGELVAKISFELGIIITKDPSFNIKGNV